MSRPQELLQLLTRTERLAARRLHGVLDEFGCSVEAWRVLDLLSDGRGHNMTAIADCAFLPPPSLTKLMDQLVEQNHVYRRVDPTDRRRILARLTPRGQQYWHRLSRRVQADWAELPAGLAQDEVEELHALLARFADVLDGSAGTVASGRGAAAGRVR